MAINQEYLEYITQQLTEFGDFEIKRMFGGVGLFRDGLMFGLIGKDKLHLKADETSN